LCTRTCVHDLAVQIERHDALAPVHLVARAEHALGVADVGAFDLDDFGQARCAVAAGREQQAADGPGLLPQHRLGGLANASLDGGG
jgi:hypothetical protein